MICRIYSVDAKRSGAERWRCGAGRERSRRGEGSVAVCEGAAGNGKHRKVYAWRSRKVAALTRFWQAVEQKRLLPLREVST